MQDFKPNQSLEPAVAPTLPPRETNSSGLEPAPSMQTVCGRLFMGSGGSLMIAVEPREVGIYPRALVWDGKEFAPKSEARITIAHFKIEEERRKDRAKHTELDAFLEQLSGDAGIPITFDAASGLIHIANDYYETHAGAGKVVARREALIRAVDCPRAKEIVERVGQFLGKEASVPYLHLALYTYGSNRLIAVPDLETLAVLRQRELSAAQVANLFQEQNKSIEKQIERFMATVDQIRTGPKVEVDLNSRAKLQELRECVISALMSAEPIDALGDAIQNPEVASILRKVLDLRGTPQDPHHHPEGDALVHTLMVVAQAARICVDRSVCAEDRKLVMLGALLHDIGKGEPNITRRKPSGSGGEIIVAYGHELAGVRPAREILCALGLLDCSPAVLSMVKNHMVLPARYREVQSGAMEREKCIERTRQLIERECYEFNPEVLLICNIADWLGRGTARTQAQRQALVKGFSAVWHEAQEGQ